MQKIVLVLFLATALTPCYAQQKSDTTKGLVKRIRDNKTAQRLIHNFIRKQDTVFNVKSEDPFIAYEGKIIRRIVIEHIGFEKNVIDTSRTLLNFISKTANKLHEDSKPWVIRDNLFIREGQPLNSYRVADNERYLRDLDFILDSRIYVKQVPHSRDSVDLLVVTRDVFSLGGALDPSSPTKFKVSVYEANLLGYGQRVQISTLFDATRKPRTGFEWLYKKTNVMGSFINATLDYAQITPASPTNAYGAENETSYFIQLSRALFMPYTRWAGGVLLSHNHSANVYSKPDTTFERYRYNIQDYWMGYSFGHKKKLNEIRENRNRKFIALRGFQQHYTELPLVFSNPFDRLLYHNRTALLGQLTFFRQDFYKTRYVLGFGRTEDVPYGYRISITGGWEKEETRQRPYAGIEVYRNVVDRNGAFFTYSLKVASFYRDQLEDALTSISLTRYSKIYEMGRSQVRHQLDGGYARLYNRREKRPLGINDIDGITGFRPDSLLGNQRLNFRYEVVIFTPWKLLGFRIAPTARAEFVYISPLSQTVFGNGKFFAGISGGVRVRNENLIFNTIEARILYYPKTIERINHIGFSVQANLRIKYPTNLVSAPATFYN